MIKNVYFGLHKKYPLLLPGFNEIQIFLYRFSKNTQISNFTKIPRVGAEFFYVNRRTDRHDEAKRRFSQFREGLYVLLSKFIRTLTVTSESSMIIFERQI
jgi:hypothetical protein